MTGSIELDCRPTSARVSLNEPVVVDCTIANRTGVARRIDLGADRVGAFVISIEAPIGGATGDLRCEPGGFVQSGNIEIPPHSASVERLLLQRWYRFAVEGRYTVRLALIEGSTRVSAPAFEVNVLPRDPARLREVAESLATVAMSHGDAERSGKAAEALSCIADPVAVPYLVQLAAHGHASTVQAIEGLTRIDDDSARAQLQVLAADRNQEIAALARRALRGAPGGTVMD